MAVARYDPLAWVGVRSLPVIQSNIQAYKELWKRDPPDTLVSACQKSHGSGP